MSRLTLIGSPISPFVRKVAAVLDLKGLAYELDPVVAFYTDERFRRLNPLRRVPVLLDGDAVVVDSSVIVAYVEEAYPDGPSILPPRPVDRARSRFLEEYADTHMADVFLWRVFNAVVLKPGVWGEPRDPAVYKAAIEGPVAEICEYLESVAPRDGFLFDGFSLADLSVCVMFRNLRYARFTPDRWSRLSAWIGRVEAHPAVARSTAWADALVASPIAEHREKAGAAGAPLAPETLLADGPPRSGPMTVRL